ncbi:unnamed protein product (macronuclear) [Paramecium tetraurelia]|uniref:EGF-like domain-containing protein n=1 Tax=Paramecium tetraurelia TaxID=5888 RepID=A0CTG8_PARTE|nr:uncharacterized protein GSPATT00010319001 [Paramecium tetraurelia]CAK74085.1 unnamed protein product [Paramecium tetraurelia]|eukprot:XP_001441482.1 hypothetical protein (macronuclear) [Paramecium tetraurelia strain d4-2]
MFFILLSFLPYMLKGEWIQIDSSFYDTSVSSNNWKTRQDCSCNNNCSEDFQQDQCSSNPLQYNKLKKDRERIEKTFSQQSFQVYVIFDAYFNHADSSKDSDFYVTYREDSSSSTINLYTKQYKASDLNQLANRICTGGGDYEFDLYTVVSTTITNAANKFSIKFCLNPEKDEDTIFLRNILVYVNICYPTCKTCSTSTTCSSCYYGSVSSGSCGCDPSHQFAQTAVGCRQECERDYYIARSDSICVPDRRIKSSVKYFDSSSISSSDNPRYQPFVFIPDIFHYQNTDLVYDDCDSDDFVGELFFNEGMQLSLGKINAIKFIRLRVTFYCFSFQTNSKIQFFVDNIQQGELLKTSSSYSYNQITKIFTDSDSCDSKSYTLIRIEAIFRTYSDSPQLIFQGKLQQSSESWGFRNVTIDVGLCQENCKICSDFATCSQCESGYTKFQNGCVSSCPAYSSNCVDYADMISYSRYLAKGFYDLNMTISDVESFYDTVTTTGNNQKTGQKFSFFPNKFVLGGVMVWRDAKYHNSWPISKPHYAITIRFNLTYGDEYSGNFYYKIGTTTSAAFTKPGSGYNLIGKNKEERVRYFEIYKNPFTDPSLDLELQCTGGNADFREEFCAISEYFIVVHYCPPFCSACTSATACTTWDSGHTSSSCLSNQFLSFDSSTQIYSCVTCSQTGCLTCKSLEDCTSCTYTATNQFYLVNGICQCYPFLYLSGTQCTQCNKYCENCNGAGQTNCITCVSDFHRSISFNQCLCQPGFYDDGVNLPCLPICGDKLVVDGEDCDDGNYNPFDGCYNCQFSCDFGCSICVKGICEDCKSGYQLTENNCVSICQDNIIVQDEECEDNNLTPYDGCFNCKFQCLNHCVTCTFGVCTKCDEQNGWYLEDNICQPKCDDGIVTLEVESCDDNNENPNDGCDKCEYSCILNCSQCQKGKCLYCDSGYTLISKTNVCIPTCGDGLVVSSEICDDGNIIKYDGCFKCQLSCQDSCSDCQKEGCLECNTTGWMYNPLEMRCETICGDGIKVKDYEECDDLLDENCYQCKYQCQESCKTCYQGFCLKCNKGWTLNSLEKYCYPTSGDSLIVGSEQCDDYNQMLYDGCYLSQYQCQETCLTCYKGLCQNCVIGYYLYSNKCYEISDDGIVIGKEQCDDQNLVAQDGCFQNRFDCPKYCSSCVYGQCQKCLTSSGYGKVDQLQNQCVSFCGDGIKSIEEECDDGNDMQYDGCFNCQYSCDAYCDICNQGKCDQCLNGYYLNTKTNTCYSICGDAIVVFNEQCDDGNKISDDGCSDCNYQCHKQCTTCIDGLCYQCTGIGWEINTLIRECQPVCGDGIVIGNEQCDDANDIGEDGCYQCYFECQKQCTRCIKGFCEECNTLGWQLDWNYCIPICGDKLVIGNEECDDGNQIPYDGCFECNYQCQPECTDCQLGVCYKCGVQGWDIENHICFPVCGDGYVVKGQEQCDDGNTVEFDGCFMCQYQCEEMCTTCELGICYECDVFGWVIEQHKCTPYCGDGVVIGYEQCDDMNDDFNDGCYKCKLACDQYCTDCLEGICQKCEIGRFVDQNICIAQCGDGVFVKSAEACDDGNFDDGDGCNSQCLIENDFVCFNNEGTFSNCFYSKQPSFTINLVTKAPEDFEDVQVKFDQKMKYASSINNDISNFVITDILNMENSEFQITQSVMKASPSDEITEIVLNFKINFFVPVDSPVFQIKFIDEPILSEFNLTLKESQGTLVLLTPSVLSQAQKAIAQSASAFNQAVIYSLAGLSSLCLLTGSSDIFWNLMDQLQYLSYIKYINIQFPNNLNIYFDVFKLITISPLMSAFGIDKFFNSLDGDATYFIPTMNKFQKDEINAYFFTNFQSFLFCFTSAFGGYLATKYIHILLYKIGPYYVSKINLTIGKLIYSTRRSLKQKSKQFYYNGILRIIMSNSYDVCFATTIQLSYFQSQDSVLVINSYLSLFVFTTYILISLYTFHVMQSFSSTSTLKVKNKFDALFEGVQESKSVWVTQFNAVLLIKKMVFISLIVFMQKEGQLQTLCIAINQTLFLCYLIANRPLSNQYEYYKNIITESLIIFNTITFLFYAYRVEMSLTLENSISLGWLHILTSTSILAVSFIFDFIQQSKLVLEKLRKAFQGPKVEEQGAAVTLFY